MTLRMQKLILIWHFYFWQLLFWARQSYMVLLFDATWEQMFRVKLANMIARKSRFLEISNSPNTDSGINYDLSTKQSKDYRCQLI